MQEMSFAAIGKVNKKLLYVGANIRKMLLGVNEKGPATYVGSERIGRKKHI
jgi:hypothetical protein